MLVGASKNALKKIYRNKKAP
ncbi:hypothetical protein EMIT0P44_130122 [Pseudomonas sp. IT-P44]